MSLLTENELQDIGYRAYLEQLANACGLEENKKKLLELIPSLEVLSSEDITKYKNIFNLRRNGFEIFFLMRKIEILKTG